MQSEIDQTSKKIKEEAENFRNNRKQLLNIANDTIFLLIQLTDDHPCVRYDSFDTKPIIELGQASETHKCDSNAEKLEFLDPKNPTIGIIGRPNVGKTSLMKTIGRIKRLTYAERSQNFTRFSYSKKQFANVCNEDGTCSKISSLMKLLPKRMSRRKDLFNRLQYIGIDSSFLSSGLEFIEVSSLNFSNLMMLKTKWIQPDLLPIVICVLHESKSDIPSISAELAQVLSNKNVTVFYFVNIFEDDSLPNAIEKNMETFYSDLQRNGLLSQTAASWDKCCYFHYFSLLRITKYFDGKRGTRTNFHYSRFRYLESCLLEFLQLYFGQKIRPFYNKLLTFQIDLISKLMEPTEDISMKTNENIKQINELRSLKTSLVENSTIQTSRDVLISRLILRLQEESNQIIHRIRNLDQSYFIWDASEQNASEVDKNKEFHEILREAIVEGLYDIVKDFIDQELFETSQNFIGNKSLCSMMDRGFLSKNFVSNDYPSLIETKLKEFYVSSSCLDERFDEGFINIFFDALRNYLPNLEIPVEQNDHCETMSGEWKLQAAREFLSNFNLHLLADDVCSFLINHIRKRREEIVAKIDAEIDFYNCRLLFSQTERMAITKSIPKLFPYFLQTFNIKCKYEMDPLKRGERICTRLDQDIYIYRPIKAVGSDNDIAGREMKLSKSDIRRKAEEIYYSKILCHPRLYKMLGISIDPKEEKLTIFHPLMKTDLERYMKDNVVRLDRIIHFAIQIAEGLKYLHENGMMHRDLTLSNILLDVNNDVVLSDYGSCKSSALCNFTIMGTATHIAPEISKNQLYTTSIDVYSFATVLRCLFHDKSDKQFLERSMNIPVELWELMVSCWDENPNNRPSIADVIVRLQRFKENMIN